MALGVAGIVGSVLAALLAVLEAALGRWAVGVYSLGWSIALGCIAVLGLLLRIPLLAISLLLRVAALGVVWWALVVWV